MLKGALISYMPTFLTAVPNVIVFQISPETMSHSWSQPAPASQSADGERSRFDPLAVTGVPGEKFSFTRVKPLFARLGLALWTMAIAAGVIGDGLMTAS